MQRPHIVAVGGTEDQPLDCLYCGADGAAAVAAYLEAANDGGNELVRLFMYPDYCRITFPKRHGVPVVERPDLDDLEPERPTVADMEAAIRRIEELSGFLAAERDRVADLEKALAKAATPVASIKPRKS